MLIRFLLLALMIAATSAADPVGVSVYEDAEGDVAAASVFGNATGAVAASVTGNATTCGPVAYCGIAVSGLQSATCSRAFVCAAASLGGDAAASGRCVGGATIQVCGAGIAVAGGNATSDFLAVAVAGEGKGREIAISGGHAACSISVCFAMAIYNASACNRGGGDNCLAIALVGDADACRQDPNARAYHCLGVSAAGESSACEDNQESFQCISLGALGDARSNVAVSVAGDATGRQNRISGTQIDVGALAVSGTGDATSCSGSERCVAVSGTGHASGASAVSGCDTLAAQGRPEACSEWWRPEVDGLLP